MKASYCDYYVCRLCEAYLRHGMGGLCSRCSRKRELAQCEACRLMPAGSSLTVEEEETCQCRWEAQ